jgi:predicted nucleic acid-binding protein
VIVVSDTTPLNYLVLIDAIHVLPDLFSEVYTPNQVILELCHECAPATVRAWAQNPPSWLRVTTPASRLPSTLQLDPGEADAISLAKEIRALAVLLDEVEGRKVALAEGLVVVRTLALLELAAEKQLIKLRPILERLMSTTFRLDAELIEAALAREASRSSARPEGPQA